MMNFDEWWEDYYGRPTNEVLTEYERDVAKDAWDAQQAEIDRLMFEYCPNEMSKEQKDNWVKNQVVDELKSGKIDFS